MSDKPRRVVTGLNAAGKSCVLIDGPVLDFGIAWRNGTPADNAATADCALDAPIYDMMHSGAMLMVVDFLPGTPPRWHATDTIDYIVVISGEVVLELETGDVTLKAGDVAIDRGVVHSWRNDSGQPARAAIAVLPAHPVGAGRTV
jgi:mannose-6-phosphate isomerase-like protein (cupin superfamily)